MPTATDTLANAHAMLAGVQDKSDQLRNIKQLFIDLSLRANPVGERVGACVAVARSCLPSPPQAAGTHARRRRVRERLGTGGGTQRR